MAQYKEGDWVTISGHRVLLGSGGIQEAIDKIKSGENKKSNTKSDKKEQPKKSVADKNADTKEKQIAKAQAEAKKLNDEQKYQNELKNGANLTIDKDGRMMMNGKPLDKLDTTDATKPGDNPNYPKGDSLYQHLDKNGNLTAERQEMHRQIIEDVLKESGAKPYPPNAEKKALFTGGGGASGKGAFGKDIGKFYSSNDHPIKIDPDDLKAKLAMKDGVDLRKGMDAGFYHEESSALAKQIYAMGLAHRYPTFYDGTSTNVKSTLARIEQARSAGYKTEMNFVRADWNTVMGNAIYRFAHGDEHGAHRLVPIKELIKAHKAAPSAVRQLSSKVDKFTLYNNADRNRTKIAEQTKGGELKILDQRAYNAFNNQEKEFTLGAKEMEAYYANAKREYDIVKKRSKSKFFSKGK